MDKNNSNDETETATPAIDWAGLARPLAADPRVFDRLSGALFNSAAVSVLVDRSESVAIAVAGPEQGLVNTSTQVKVRNSSVLVGLDHLGGPVAVLIDCDADGEAQP